jgi:hypothetical protein
MVVLIRALSVAVGLLLFSILPGVVQRLIDPASSIVSKLGAYLVLLLCLSAGAVLGEWGLRWVRKSVPRR